MLKKKYLKIIFPIFAVLSACFSPLPAETIKDVRTIFDGRSLKPIELYSYGRYSYFSVRQIADVFGISTQWHQISEKVSLRKDNKTIDIFAKSTRVHFDGQKKRLQAPARLKDNDILIPVEFILSNYFMDFTRTKISFNEKSYILKIVRKANVRVSKISSRQDFTNISIQMYGDISYRWGHDTKEDEKAVFISFARGITRSGKIKVGDGTVRKISLSNNGRQAEINIDLEDSTEDAELEEIKTSKNLKTLILRIPRNPFAGVPQSPDTVNTQNLGPKEPEKDIPTGTTSSIGTENTLTPMPVIKKAKKKGKKNKKLIILDAGHGGKDPGAIGPDGTLEKNIVLSIVKRLKTLFEQDKQYKILLTREDDTFIPLVERTNMANEEKADLFVSVHCNANANRRTSGFEVYFLSENASDSEAAATAVLENSVVHLEGKPSKKRAALQSLLWSMAVNEFINESSEVSSYIATDVEEKNNVENRGVKQAGFFVLRGAGMPAVLIETAFISNPKEEEKLKTSEFQDEIARSIYEGISDYISKKGS
ncbi:N-acetylmuramoyl-L-alanine amidase [Elusimicrobiota bacterium]